MQLLKRRPGGVPGMHIHNITERELPSVLLPECASETEQETKRPESVSLDSFRTKRGRKTHRVVEEVDLCTHTYDIYSLEPRDKSPVAILNRYQRYFQSRQFQMCLL